MVPLNSPDLRQMAYLLKNYDRQNTVSFLAALLTCPSFQANTLRIDTALHLSVAYCAGARKVTISEVAQWLNDDSLMGCIRHLEDPTSDVFVTNVETAHGNRRIFEGDWTSNAYYAQSVIDCIAATGAPQECVALRQPLLALLRLSEEVADRLKLERWSSEQSVPGVDIALPSAHEISRRAKALEFTDDQLQGLGISTQWLAPFILRDADRNELRTETPGHTTLERRPILNLGTKVLLAVPAAVSPAIRRYVIAKLLRTGQFRSFASAISRRQAAELKRDCLQRIEGVRSFLHPPSAAPPVPPSHEWLVRYDENKYVHAILLEDEGLRAVDTEGLCSHALLSRASSKALEQHIDRVAKGCQSVPGFSIGWSIVVVGGLGRAMMFDFGSHGGSWHMIAITIPDFVLLCNEEDRPFRRFLKFAVQRDWLEERGVTFGHCPDYDLYAYWRQNDFRFLHRSMAASPELAIFLGSDMSAPARTEVRRSVDPHVAQSTDGFHCSVFRFTGESLFAYQRDRPIYLSKDHLDRRVLAAVVETKRGGTWLITESDSEDVRHREFVYEFFRSFIYVYERLVHEVESRLERHAVGPLEVRFDLKNIRILERRVDVRAIRRSRTIDVALDHGGGTATLTFPEDTLLLFNEVENAGERLVLRAIARALLGLHLGCPVDERSSQLDRVTEDILAEPGSRLLHVFSDVDSIQQLLMTAGGEPVFLSKEDYAFSKCRLGSGQRLRSSSRPLVSTSECTRLLNGLVADVWKELQSSLRVFNRGSLVRAVVGVHEAAISDRYHWRRTARAVLSLHSQHADVFETMKERESSRTNIQLPARTLIEMAHCESRVTGGNEPSTWEVDALLAKTRLLLQIATDSDAIYHGLAQPSIEVHLNGEYSLSSEFYESVLQPFVAAQMREGHEEASHEYEDYYKTTRDETLVDPFPPEFAVAFRVEFGIQPSEVMECVAELADWCNEVGGVVIETTVGEVKQRLMVNRGLDAGDADAFVRSFGLLPRESWERPPTGYLERDIWPWRYGRRLSVIARPLIVWGLGDSERLVFGLGTLVESILHVTMRAAEGRISQNFFGTPDMLAYLGTANDKLGHEFNGEVAQEVSRQGWCVREEVAMTELRASETLGDVDVLAWKPGGDVQIIECKRLQLARTVAEVAELCKRFRGEENDKLRKHVRRAEWIRSNPGCLSSIVRFRADPARITDRIVTNVHVPMTYVTSLPVEPDKIGPLPLD